MEYNWGDPKKNSLLSSRMMAKAEVTRKKRLTNVKSTLSNQLHPAIEHKLRKKKKAPDSARAQTNGSNNELLESHAHADQLKAEPQMTSDDESSTLDTIRHDAFPVPARTSFSNNASMFDEFGLNAAADGLFHPASAIEAFTEHDAKYHQEILQTSGKPHSGPRRARSGMPAPDQSQEDRNAVKSNSIPPALTPNTADASDPWKQYEDDDEDGEDDDNNELESSSEVKRETTSVDRYSDEDFESDCRRI
ncbi:uncharacterized protein IUM83_10922 [Phytophthora cinnamomi]|uniref:uncharacterized protein n=1 Tax=Phytophthora cinnamomi TaxID=4785 RepID=UPI003559781F|nr:hypothetical protein IUM83_10922 [Phytophthora cinnamomi]